MTSILSATAISFSRVSRAMNVPVRPIPALENRDRRNRINQFTHVQWSFVYFLGDGVLIQSSKYGGILWFGPLVYVLSIIYRQTSIHWPAVDKDRSVFWRNVLDYDIPEFQQRVDVSRDAAIWPSCEVIVGHSLSFFSLKQNSFLIHKEMGSIVQHTLCLNPTSLIPFPR